MRTPAPLITALALGVLVTHPLSAQTATDLTAVCKAVGDAKTGQWASFDATSGSEGGKVRLANIGSQRAGDTTLYWFEVNVAATDPSHGGVLQLLAPSLSAGMAGVRSVILKWGLQPAVKVSGQMAALLIEKTGQNNSVIDWAARCTTARVVGRESVTVPGGTFQALHANLDDGTDVWASSDVPFGLVKLRGKDGVLALTARGSDAKSSLTEKPLDMGGMMGKP